MNTADIKHLNAMYMRLILAHGENPYCEDMIKFQNIIADLYKSDDLYKRENSTINYPSGPLKHGDQEFSLFSKWRDEPKSDHGDDSWNTGTIKHFQD